MNNKRGLGMGIDCKIPSVEKNESIKVKDAAEVLLSLNENDQPKVIDISMLTLDPDQPTKHFDEEELKDLVESIKEYGLLNPIIVKEMDDQYMIIAGARRWRAAQIAGLTEIPVVVRSYSEQERAIGLVENLNLPEEMTPQDEHNLYRRLIDDFGLSLEEIAETMSVDIEYLKSLGL